MRRGRRSWCCAATRRSASWSPRRAADGVAQVELDYVTPRFRDFTPGEFVYRRSGLFTGRGYRQVLTPPGMVAPYYESLGFRRDGDHWALDL